MGPPKAARNRNRVLEDRLWDEDGREWHRVELEIPRDRILELLRRPGIKVGIHMCRSVLRWVPESARLDVWNNEVEPDFHDRPDWRPPRDAPGQLPFVGTLWRSGIDELLLFDDLD